MSRFVLTAQLQLQAPNNVAQVVRQIQSQLNNVSVNVQVQGAAQAQRQLQQVTTQTQAATTAADRMGRAFAISIRRFAAFSIATRAVGLFTSTLSDAIKTAIDFEREMIRISQVTGKALGELKSFTKTVTDLSTGLGVASADLLQAGQLLLQAGISAKDTEVALKTLAKAALAPNFDSLSETTEGAIAILAQFGEGVGALEKQLGAINAVAGAFAVEAGDLIDVIRRAGGVFKSSGGDLNELIALFTSVRATTRESAESIGTGLRTIFTRIQRPKTIEFLKQFGVELVDMEGKFVGPYEAVRRLSTALAGLGEGDITFIRIAEELGGFRQIGKVLPLLQQFSTAQNALNVANKAGNSLTQDAATAQQALAIRILKVREEFLALIRSITETSTFQIMANTALSLASALIKIGEAIKPLLPLLAAVAAINFTKGIAGFAGGMMRGMQSGRTYSTGGKVHHFARGGMVPGTGNRDTVPAMLQPGEFVIKKSSVNKLGAGNLAAMNENRYNRGTEGRGIVGATKQLKSVEKRKSPYAPKESMPGSGMVKFNVNEGQIGAFVLQPAKGTEGSYTATKPYPFTLPPSNRYAQLAAKQAGLSPADISGGINATINPASYPIFYPGMNEGRSNLQKNAKYAQAVTKGFNDAISTGVNSTIQSVTSQGLLDIPPAYNTNENLLRNTIASIQSDNQVRSSIEGYLFEGMISAFTGAQAAGGRANFDFPRSAISQNKDKLATLFGSGPMINKLIKAEAKRSYGEVGGNIQRKLANDIMAGYKGGVSIQTVGKKFATGGGVGTDTVPALLTPGEFVINRSSAQGIGYGNLNRMNKVGKYAKGGIVQRFAAGGGVKRGGDALFEQIAVPNLSKMANSVTKVLSVLDKLSGGTLLKAAVAIDKLVGAVDYTRSDLYALRSSLSRLDYMVPGFTKAFDENSKANKRNVLKQSQLIGVIDGQIAAMQNAGMSQKQVAAAVNQYVTQLNTNTAQLKSGASLTAIAASSPTGSQPIGAFGAIPRAAAAAASAAPAAAPATGSLNAWNAATNSVKNNTAAMIDNTTANKNAAKTTMDVVNNNKMFAASMAVSLIQGFLPAIDENSSTMLRATHSLLGLMTTIASVGFALEAFGVSLSLQELTSLDKMANRLGLVFDSVGNIATTLYQNIASVITGKVAETAASTASATADTAEAAASSLAAKADLAEAASSTKSASAFGKSLGALAIGLTAALAVVKTISGFQRQGLENAEKTAVQTGNVEEARKAGGRMAGLDFIEGLETIGTVVGSVVAGGAAILGAFGTGGATALGTGVAAAAGGTAGGAAGRGLGNLLIGDDTINAGATASASAAQFVKTGKLLEKSGEKAAKALERLGAGSISAKQALESMSTENQATVDAIKAAQQASAAADKATKPTTFRTVAAYATLGYMDSNEERATKTKAANEARRIESQRMASQQLQTIQPMLNKQMRRVAAADPNADFDDFISSLDTATFNLLNLTDDGIKNAYEAFVNIQKEIERTKAALEAMNLGLRGPTATATAMSASMAKFSAGLEVGGNSFVSNTEFLSQAMTSAAQAMNPDDIKSAVNDISNNLSNMGVGERSITKFRANTEAFIQAQQNYNQAFKNIKDSMASNDFTNLSPDQLKDAFAKELTVGLGDEAKKNLTDIIKGINLTEDEVDEILGGNLQVFGDKLSEAGQKQFEDIMKIAQERQKAEQVIIQLTQQRIEAERNLVEAQKEAVDLYMEGRDIQAKYGGAPVNAGEKRLAILAKANAGATGAGIGQMRTGSVAELRARNAQIAGGFFGIERRRSVEGGMQGKSGVEADATQQNLQKAQKDQIQTIRELIKLEEEELKIIQEKNKLEKDSLESLISGDVEKFFEQQAAVGATAAIATGDMALANQFGSKAMGDAFKDIQRQQEAGVQSLYGRQLAGAGGLVESAAGAALGGRGIMDPRMAQVLAGTTPEEEASKRRLQELGGVLGETGAFGAAMAEMQVQTAQINVSSAEIKLAEIEERGRQAAEGFAKGGVVYANRGMFVPRGTDTVPAMLTPGEFVVRREAVNRGNNLQLLQAINNNTGSQGFARGGKVGYYNNGGKVQYKAFGGLLGSAAGAFGIDPKLITNLGNIFNTFIGGFNESIKNLQNTKLQIKLDSVNVNVNLTGTSMLTQITDATRQDIIKQVVQKLQSEYGVGSSGKLTENKGNLPRPGN